MKYNYKRKTFFRQIKPNFSLVVLSIILHIPNLVFQLKYLHLIRDNILIDTTKFINQQNLY